MFRIDENKLDAKTLYVIAAFIMLIAPASIVASFIFNFGYFNFFNISLFQVPVDWSDYVLSTVYCFILFLAIFLINFATEFQFKRVEGYQTEEELTKGNSKIKAFRSSTKYIYPVILTLTFLSYILQGRTFEYQKSLIAFLGCILFVQWFISHENYSKRVNYFIRIFFPVILIFFVTLYFLGSDKAESNYNNSGLLLNYSVSNKKVTYSVLRVFDKFFLVKDKENKTKAIYAQNSHVIEVNKPPEIFDGYLCEYLKKNSRNNSKLKSMSTCN